MLGVNYMTVQHWLAGRRRPRPQYVARLRALILQLAGELPAIAHQLQLEHAEAERRRQERLAAFCRRMGEGHVYKGGKDPRHLQKGQRPPQRR